MDEKDRGLMLVKLDDSQIRFSFDKNLQLKQVLSPDEFLSIKITNLPEITKDYLVNLLTVDKKLL